MRLRALFLGDYVTSILASDVAGRWLRVAVVWVGGDVWSVEVGSGHAIGARQSPEVSTFAGRDKAARLAATVVLRAMGLGRGEREAA